MTTKITLTSWDVKSSQRQHVCNKQGATNIMECHAALECFVNTTCNGSLPHWRRMRNATRSATSFCRPSPLIWATVRHFHVHPWNGHCSGEWHADILVLDPRHWCFSEWFDRENHWIIVRHPERLMQFDPKAARDQCNLVSQPMAASGVGGNVTKCSGCNSETEHVELLKLWIGTICPNNFKSLTATIVGSVFDHVWSGFGLRTILLCPGPVNQGMSRAPWGTYLHPPASSQQISGEARQPQWVWARNFGLRPPTLQGHHPAALCGWCGKHSYMQPAGTKRGSNGMDIYIYVDTQCINVSTNQFINVCMCVWMDGWMDVWMDGWMYACMYGWMYGWMYGCMDVWMHICMHVGR